MAMLLETKKTTFYIDLVGKAHYSQSHKIYLFCKAAAVEETFVTKTEYLTNS